MAKSLGKIWQPDGSNLATIPTTQADIEGKKQLHKSK